MKRNFKMNLQDFKKKNLIFESKWKTVALVLISGLFVFAAMEFKVYEERPLLFWPAFILFGCGFLIGLYKLLNPKNLFLSPGGKRSKEYEKLDFEERSEDNGIFSYSEIGFTVKEDDITTEHKWSAVAALFGFKEDRYTYDNICLDVFTENGHGFSISEDTSGWFQFLMQSKANIPEIPENWEIEIMLPAFEKKHTLLFDRENRTFEEALDFYYDNV